MNRRIILLTATVLAVTGCFFMQGCIQQHAPAFPEIASIQADTTVLLKPEVETSPDCRISIDFMYLKPASPTDSVSEAVNRIFYETVSEKTAGAGALTPEAFVNSMKEGYIDGYRKNLQKFYDADLHNGVKQEDIPAWYNNEYEITSTLEMGRDSVWNYQVSIFEDTGGAHPNTRGKWVNIDAATGKLLTRKDVFLPNTDQAICEMILKQLLNEANKRLETDTISSIEGLRSVGALLEGDLFVPDNFKLGKDGVTFLYNRYDIAPYTMGDFQLTVPYAEIENCLLKK